MYIREKYLKINILLWLDTINKEQTNPTHGTLLTPLCTPFPLRQLSYASWTSLDRRPGMTEIRTKHGSKITKIPNQIYLADMPRHLRSPREEFGVQSLSLPQWLARPETKTITWRKPKHESQTPIPQPTKKTRRGNALTFHFPTIANRQTIAIYETGERLNSSIGPSAWRQPSAGQMQTAHLAEFHKDCGIFFLSYRKWNECIVLSRMAIKVDILSKRQIISHRTTGP